MLKAFFRKISISTQYTLPILSLLCGLLFFCFYQQWIIIHFSFNKKHSLERHYKHAQTKPVSLFFWNHTTWNREQVDIVWSEDLGKTLEHVLNAYFSLLDEEGLLKEKVQVTSVSTADTIQTAFVSFDRYPFNKEDSTRSKLMILEGAIKTIRESTLKISHIYFLLHHNPIPDHHLDFSHPWPIQGFLD